MSTIGIITTGVIGSDYLGEVFRGVADTVKQYRHQLMVNIQNETRSDDLDRFLGENGCDGVITVVPNHYARVLESCRRYGRDYVQIDYLDDEFAVNVPTVQPNNYEVMTDVVNHLLAFGHRRIAFVTGNLTHAGARQRLQAYQDSLSAANLPLDPALIGEGDWLYPSAYRIAQEFLSLPEPPTAIIASNDGEALGVINAIRERGLEIGRHVSVTGFDNIRAASTAGLTTVHQPIYELGKTAVEMLLQRLRGEMLPELHVQLKAQLIIRQSTGPVWRG